MSFLLRFRREARARGPLALQSAAGVQAPNYSVSRRREALAGWLMAGPAIGLIMAFTAAPLVFAVYMSLRDVNVLRLPGEFVGLENFRRLLDDRLFVRSVLNSLYYAALLVPANTVLGLGLAVLLNRPLPGLRVLRTIFLLPIMVSGVVAATVWKLLLNTDAGVVNAALSALGLARQPLLQSPDQALPLLALMTTWMTVGGSIIIFLAGLQGIPQELYDAAAVDGATGARAFFSITLPLLQRTTAFVIILTTIVALRLFDVVYIMTQGGPQRATSVLAYYSYQQVFLQQRLGYGSALGIALLLIILVITLVQLRLARGGADY
jgi:multiple sugar transport system permease protein